MQVKKQQLKPDMEPRTGSKLGKEYVKAIYCHPAYLTSMQSTSCKMPGWITHKLESRLLGETSTTLDKNMNNKSLVLYEEYEQLIYGTVDHRKSKRIPEKHLFH